jgi:para-nitrobenzyl esterase
MPPQKPPVWANVRNTFWYGPACPQATGRYNDLNQFFFEFTERTYVDEDCLSLNVWTPGVTDQRKRPVMFWLHGGGFVFGSSFELPSYDGRNLAQRGDVVVVSINHRINAFGYLYLAEYGQQFSDSGNVGMLDIVAALQWVHETLRHLVAIRATSRSSGSPRRASRVRRVLGYGEVTLLMPHVSAR